MRFLVIYSLLFGLGCSSLPSKNTVNRSPDAAPVVTGPVALVYHRFAKLKGKASPAGTSIEPELFKKHIEYLKKPGKNFKIIDAEEAITNLRASSEQGQQNFYPKRHVVITFDDPWRSIYTTGRELFKKYDLPVTLFINTNDVGSSKNHMTWKQINEMLYDESSKVKIGCHSHKHANMPSEMTVAEMRKDLQTCIDTIKEKTGFTPKLFAYPYGEYSKELRDLVEEMGFIGAFAQYSGVMHESSDPYIYPRFPMNDHYGTVKKAVALVKFNSLPMPMELISSDTDMMRASEIPARVEFKLDPRLKGQNINCYSHVKKVRSKHDLGKYPKTMWRDGNHFILQFNEKFKARRDQIACTLDNGYPYFYWHAFKLGDPNRPER